MIPADFDKQFEYENGYYLTAPVNRISKFVTHLDLFRMVSGLPGEIVECGVFKGASLMRLVKLRSLLENPFSRRIIGFDIFGRFPDAGYELDKARRDQFVAEAGENSISVEDLRGCLQRLNLDQNIELVAGDINQTVPAYVEGHPHLKIALLHIDVDLLEPTRTCLKHLFPRVVRGGVVVLDDYGAFAGANKAIDDYFQDNGIVVRKLPFTNAISYVVKE